MFSAIYGVDFSGAKLAGRNTWVARLEPVTERRRPAPYRLAALASLEKLCGTAERAPALAHLAGLIAASEQALWALDFPFGLPIEVMEPGVRWPAQLDFLHAWGEDAYAAGLECLRGPGTRRRLRGTAILPFQYGRLASARRVLVEACPTSTLKRLGLPHNNYKQPEGGPLTRKRLRRRRAILDGLTRHVTIAGGQRWVLMRNGGGDALDAVIAAVGAAQAWQAADHQHIARHPRYPREGRLYV